VKVAAFILLPALLLMACSQPSFASGDSVQIALARCDAKFEDFIWGHGNDGSSSLHVDPRRPTDRRKSECMKRWASVQPAVTFEETES
jgi:hypothetical protein